MNSGVKDGGVLRIDDNDAEFAGSAGLREERGKETEEESGNRNDYATFISILVQHGTGSSAYTIFGDRKHKGLNSLFLVGEGDCVGWGLPDMIAADISCFDHDVLDGIRGNLARVFAEDGKIGQLARRDRTFVFSSKVA